MTKVRKAIDQHVKEFYNKYMDENSDEYDPFTKKCLVKLKDIVVRMDVAEQTLRGWSVYKKIDSAYSAATYQPYKGLIINVEEYMKQRQIYTDVFDDILDDIDAE